MRIQIWNRQRKIPCDRKRLQQFAEAAAQRCTAAELCKNVSAVEVSIVSDAKIAELHERFMGISGPTDVITFEHGEIVIGAATAESNAKRYRHAVEDEIGIYIIHGLLHLSGFQDDTAKNRGAMHRVQRKMFTQTKKAIRGGNDH
ncbi:MAG: rRNA maturation RNase YbeY [Verrucomicrobiota bacterium]|nr:rRNA maturation RNase YbeY [Verrucomicrobiota bacterium]